jgi:hypothetical protein
MLTNQSALVAFGKECISDASTHFGRQFPAGVGRNNRSNLRLEPTAPILNPPARNRNWDGRDQRPPERQNKIGNEAEEYENDPEDLAFHGSIVSFIGRLSFPGANV